jgi:putative molybdopterin biosynthesis protein
MVGGMLHFRSERIGEIRRALGITRAEFARRIGVTRQMISCYEDGIHIPGTSVLMRLSSITGAPIETFFETRPSGLSGRKGTERSA